jgi:2-oxoglutarate ferredoxin oxidoreductase subunit alpha
MQAKWGSHGDYELVAFSPWSCQEMFDLTVHAFNVADRYRVPVLLMADEVVGHMIERVEIPTEEQIVVWERKSPAQPPSEPFQPFRTEDPDLVPPIVHAGEGYRIHYTGLTHDERGYPDMTPEAHHRLVTRLVDKIRVNAEKIIRTTHHEMEDAKIVVIAYGSTARTARRAVNDARKVGIPAGFLRLVSIWPFPENEIRELAKQVDAFIVAEMNLGQISREVERHVHQPVYGVHHAGGAMMKPKTIFTTIEEIAKGGNRHRS